MNIKSGKKIIYISISAIAVIFAVLIAANLISIRTFSKLQYKSEAYSTAETANSISIKASPFFITASKGKTGANKQVKILANNGKWCKIIYTDENKITEGYVKTGLLTNIQDGLIEASMLELDKSNTVCEVGEEFQVGTALYPSYANEAIEWTSSDESVAAVENGTVTVLKSGKTTITAKIKADTKSFEITAISYDDKFQFSESSYQLNTGEKLDLSKKLEGTDNKDIKWQSTDSSIISVENGTIKAKSAGAAIITAAKEGAFAKCRIYVHNANENASKPLNMTNSYGNLYNYHPSVQYFENGWNGYKYWCAYTPYENCDDKWENPHILASNDLKNWVEPKGFSNPLEPIPENYERGHVYNSDTELVYNSDTGLLECWWRFYDRPNKQAVLRRKTTKDGVHWSEKENMLVGEMWKYDFLSPAIIYENGTYKMWAINQNTGHSIDYRESKDGKNWGEIRKIKVEYDDKKLAHWHLDVIHTAKGYEMDISAYYPEKNDRTHMDLYYSYSADNTHYTKAEMLFSPSRGTSGWDNQGLYRSSLLYADGKYYLFYSGLSTKKGPSGMGMISGSNPFTMS